MQDLEALHVFQNQPGANADAQKLIGGYIESTRKSLSKRYAWTNQDNSDALQHAVLRTIEVLADPRRCHFDGSRPLKPYISAIMKNALFDYLRSIRREPPSVSVEESPDLVTVELTSEMVLEAESEYEQHRFSTVMEALQALAKIRGLQGMVAGALLEMVDLYATSSHSHLLKPGGGIKIVAILRHLEGNMMLDSLKDQYGAVRRALITVMKNVRRLEKIGPHQKSILR